MGSEAPTPGESRTTGTADVEHDGCPYSAVLITDDGFWLCSKCGAGGWACPHGNQRVSQCPSCNGANA